MVTLAVYECVSVSGDKPKTVYNRIAVDEPHATLHAEAWLGF